METRLVLYRKGTKDETYAVLIKGTTKRYSLATRDWGEANRRYEDWKKAQTPRLSTIAEMIDVYLRDKEKTVASFANLRSTAKRVREVFGPFRPDQLTREHSRAYCRDLHKAGLADGSVIKDLQLLRAAVRWNGAQVLVEMPPPPPPDHHFLTPDEVLRLIAAADELKHQRYVYYWLCLAYATGGRMRHVLALRWDQVDFERGLIHLGVPGKTYRNKGRASVAMNDDIRAVLLDAGEDRNRLGSAYVIHRGGHPLREIRKGWATLLRHAGMLGVKRKTIRSTVGQHLQEGGFDYDAIARHLGHTSPKVTERHYAPFNPQRTRGTADALTLRKPEPPPKELRVIPGGRTVNKNLQGEVFVHSAQKRGKTT